MCEAGALRLSEPSSRVLKSLVLRSAARFTLILARSFLVGRLDWTGTLVGKCAWIAGTKGDNLHRNT